MSDGFREQILASYDVLAATLNERLGDGCGLSEDVRNHLGQRIQREMLPYIHTSELGERIYAKPRGYAGDYLTIATMYADEAKGVGRIGAIIDRAKQFHQQISFSRHLDLARKKEGTWMMLRSAVKLIDKLTLASVLVPANSTRRVGRRLKLRIVVFHRLEFGTNR